MSWSLSGRSPPERRKWQIFYYLSYFKDLSSWSKIINVFFPFALSVHLVEGSLAGPWSIWKVILCMNLFWHLCLPSLFYFIQCQWGHFDWHRSQVKPSAYSKGCVCMPELYENHLLSVWWSLTFFPTAVSLRDVYYFLGPVSFIPCLSHSPRPQGSISTAPETRCNVPEFI